MIPLDHSIAVPAKPQPSSGRSAAGTRVSFEFFPPKSEPMEAKLWSAIERLAPLAPHFVSVTYGAGGGTRSRTHRVIRRIIEDTALTPAAHLTCVGASCGEVDDVARAYWDLGVRHIVALRGDPPEGEDAYLPHPDGYDRAAALVDGLKRVAEFEISVAAYPETHPDAASAAADLDNLKRKVGAGASRAITQFFFDPDVFLRFRDRASQAGIDAPIVPGILPVTNVGRALSFAAACGASVPDWVAQLFEGLDDDPGTRQLVAAGLASQQCRRLQTEGVDEFHFYTLNRAELAVAICRMLGLRAEPEAARRSAASSKRTMTTRTDRRRVLDAAIRERILVMDGAMGTMIQTYQLDKRDYQGKRFRGHHVDLKGNNDLLNLSQPDIIHEIHAAYLDAGADIVGTNTFNATAISQTDYELSDLAFELNRAGAALAREAADAATAKSPEKPRFVAGSLGPTNRTASVSPDVSNPGYRNVTFDELAAAYKEAARGLIEGGADLLLFETVFDTLNVKAGLFAVDELFEDNGETLPLLVLGTITDMAGRNLSGQTSEAFWYSVRHAKPFAVGLNCSFGAAQMRAYIDDLSTTAETNIAAWPNAGLPNEFGEYDESPDATAAQLGEWAEAGLLNIVGGCCGTTPDHIRAIAQAVADLPPRELPSIVPRLRLSGLEAFEVRR